MRARDDREFRREGRVANTPFTAMAFRGKLRDKSTLEGKAMKKAAVVLLLLWILPMAACKKHVVREAPSPAPPSEAVQQPREKGPSAAAEESLKAVKYPGIKGEVMETSLLKDIHFDFDRYDLRPDAKRILAENARVLMENPTWKVQIEGHCDERGSNEYNLALGERRARSAMNYLIKLGISPERLSIISYGEERPLDPRHCEEAWAKNRRCHFVVVER